MEMLILMRNKRENYKVIIRKLNNLKNKLEENKFKVFTNNYITLKWHMWMDERMTRWINK